MELGCSTRTCPRPRGQGQIEKSLEDWWKAKRKTHVAREIHLADLANLEATSSELVEVLPHSPAWSRRSALMALPNDGRIGPMNKLHRTAPLTRTRYGSTNSSREGRPGGTRRMSLGMKCVKRLLRDEGHRQQSPAERPTKTEIRSFP